MLHKTNSFSFRVFQDIRSIRESKLKYFAPSAFSPNTPFSATGGVKFRIKTHNERNFTDKETKRKSFDEYVFPN